MKLTDILFETVISDLQEKKKLTYDDKFFWIAKNMGNWLYEEIINKQTQGDNRTYDAKQVEYIPFYEMYRFYLRSKTKVNLSNPNDVLQSLGEHYEDFLNVMDPRKSEDVIDEIKKQYPNISQKIARYERKAPNPNETRGRKAKPKQPKTFYTIGGKPIDISKYKPLSKVAPVDTPQEPEMANEPMADAPSTIEPKMPSPDSPAAKSLRGRPRVESEFTSQERFLFKKQGVEYIEHLENKFREYDNLANVYIRRAQEKLEDINRRKQFFGIDQETINESIEKFKSDFRRFL